MFLRSNESVRCDADAVSSFVGIWNSYLAVLFGIVRSDVDGWDEGITIHLLDTDTALELAVAKEKPKSNKDKKSKANADNEDDDDDEQQQRNISMIADCLDV